MLPSTLINTDSLKHQPLWESWLHWPYLKDWVHMKRSWPHWCKVLLHSTPYNFTPDATIASVNVLGEFYIYVENDGIWKMDIYLSSRKPLISIAPQNDTSPSPWEKCISPVLRFAPSTNTGRYTFEPLLRFFISQFPPFSLPGIVLAASLAILSHSGVPFWICNRYYQLLDLADFLQLQGGLVPMPVLANACYQNCCPQFALAILALITLKLRWLNYQHQSLGFGYSIS